MTKPSEELLRRAREFYGTLMAWNHHNVAKFAEQIVREAAEIASLDADQFEAEFPDLWIQYFDNEITLAQMDRRAILRKFGLKE